MWRATVVVVAAFILGGCKREVQAVGAALTKVLPPTPAVSSFPKVSEPAPPRPEREPDSEPIHIEADSAPEEQQPLEGNFRGKDLPSRILFEDDEIVHVWDENGLEQRTTIRKERPPGTRQCEALRSPQSYDLMICMYWFTGPGGGRVDGMVVDLAQRAVGEFFSAAMNINPLATLCFPKVHMGPMPSFTVGKWAAQAGTLEDAAEVRIELRRQGWSNNEAKTPTGSLKEYCSCVADESRSDIDCPEPKLPESTETVVYRRTKSVLEPTKESLPVLNEIGGQWGHNHFMRSWNLMMRGYRD